MSRIWFITKNILRVTLKQKSNYFIYFMLPILGLIISMALYANTGTTTIRIGIVDLDKSDISVDLTMSLQDLENFEIINMDSDDINVALLDNEVDCVVLYPEGWVESLFDERPIEVEIIAVKGAEVTTWVETYLGMYTENLYSLATVADSDQKTYELLYDGYKAQQLGLKVEKTEDEAQSRMVTVQSLGFLIMFMMLGATNSSELILREKRSRTYFRICFAPVKPKEYIISNVIAIFLIVILQVNILIALMKWVFRINTHIADWQLMMILLCFGLAAIGIGMLVAAFSKTSYQASTLSTLIITPTCMLSGCFWPAEFMPEFMQKISYFMPQRWALLAVEKLQTGVSFSEALINITLLLAFALAFFTVAAYKFKITDDVTRFV